jgi:hypothetical protein
MIKKKGYFSYTNDKGMIVRDILYSYRSYTDLINDKDNVQSAIVEDASDDPRFAVAPKGPVFYRYVDNVWVI